MKLKKAVKIFIHSKTLAIVSVIIATGAFFLQFKQLKEQSISSADQFYLANKALLEQQILGSWQTVTTKSAGNSGKIEAIEFLAKQGIPLVEIDMSEKTHEGKVFLSGLDVSEQKLGKKVDLLRANFEGANLCKATFEGAGLWDANFKKAELFGSHFEDANLAGSNFEGVKLWESYFEGANFQGANLKNTSFQNSDLTGADFRRSKNFGAAKFVNNYITSVDDYGDWSLMPQAPEGFKFELIKDIRKKKSGLDEYSSENNFVIKSIKNRGGIDLDAKVYLIKLVITNRSSAEKNSGDSIPITRLF